MAQRTQDISGIDEKTLVAALEQMSAFVPVAIESDGKGGLPFGPAQGPEFTERATSECQLPGLAPASRSPDGSD